MRNWKGLRLDNMAKTQSSFNYDEFDSVTQAFLQQKTREIKLFSSQLTAKSNLLVLQAAYTIGEKLVEVRDASSESCKPYFKAWLTNEVLKEFNFKTIGNFYNYIDLYKYTSKYLGGVAGLEANPKINRSALSTLGSSSTSNEIKQKFAEFAKSRKTIRLEDVKQAIMNERTAAKSVNDELEFGSNNCLQYGTSNPPTEAITTPTKFNNIDSFLQTETNHASTELAIRTHTKAQGMLAKLGRKLCNFVWIAPDNRSESWQNERLGDLSIGAFPKIGTDPTEQKIIPYIDVIWLGKNKRVKAVFEIECTTSIYSGLLRMTDLMELYGSLNFSFYIVVPEARVKKVKEQLSRPTFKALELDKKCKWIIIEELENKWEEMMEWGTEPAIINRIAYSLIDE